eukprot:tig00000270_g23918.t1
MENDVHVDLVSTPGVLLDPAKTGAAAAAGRARANSLVIQYLGEHKLGTAPAGDVALTIRDLNIDAPAVAGQKLPRIGECFTRTKKVRQHIVRHFTAGLTSGNLVLILGVPGAGKSSLLQTLAGNAKALGLRVSGDILFNGVQLEEARWKRQSALVEQDDLHFPMLTVKETVMFSARCRLPSTFTAEQVEQRVETCLKIMNLFHVKDTIIGRVSIAVEGVVGPPVLLMDEPSTGLDASSTLDLCKCTRALADSGHIVCMSLLQPSMESYLLFDRVVILGGGHVAYNGPGGAAPVRYFRSLGYRMPSHMNAVDFLQQVVEIAGREFFEGCQTCQPVTVTFPKTPLTSNTNLPLSYAGFGHAFKNGPIAAQEAQAVQASMKEQRTLGQASLPEGAIHTAEQRVRRLLYRDPIAVLFRLGQATMMGFMLGTLFVNLPPTLMGGNYRMSIIFFGVAGISWQATATIAKFFQERAVYYRQERAGYYRTSSFFLAHVVHEIHFFFLEALLFSLIAYFAAGFTRVDGARRFGVFLFGMFLTRLLSDGAIKIVCTLFLDVRSGSTFGPAVLSIMFIFCGFLVPRDAIPRPWIWARPPSP